ncbi:hypothetical protein [Microcoleus sp. CAWBG27]|uniref:hypothetical protein n=1 Tax=Microcoleus sp. CAWBG27 TaxID=2841645 RepID=UPI0025FF7255|nr:hypothetical protein [Microcoleus sp. CAWBG27]
MRYNAFYRGICLCLTRCFLLHHAASIANLGGIRDRQLAQTKLLITLKCNNLRIWAGSQRS